MRLKDFFTNDLPIIRFAVLKEQHPQRALKEDGVGEARQQGDGSLVSEHNALGWRGRFNGQRETESWWCLPSRLCRGDAKRQSLCGRGRGETQGAFARQTRREE